MVEDIASGTAFLEVVLSFGKAQGIIKLSKSKKTSVGGDGGTVKCQADFGVNWSRREAFSPSPMGCLQDGYATYIKLAKLWGNYSHTDGQPHKWTMVKNADDLLRGIFSHMGNVGSSEMIQVDPIIRTAVRLK